MISESIVDTFRTPIGYSAIDSSGIVTEVNPDRKQLAYKSQTVNGLGFYTFNQNLVGAKRFFLDNMARQDKIVNGNTFYHYFKRGIYHDIVYFDFKSYYVKIFQQICNHIDEQFFGKQITSIVTKKIALEQLRKKGTKFSNNAMKKPLVEIDDIASHSIKLDANSDKDEMLKMIKALSESDFVDDADMRVSKATRNALVFGFGYQQKYGKINNVSALVMFFAKEVMRHTIEELLTIGGYQAIYSHTDSFMVEHLNTGDLDQAIRTACGLVDAEFFGNTEVISLGFNDISIKGKFEDLFILNQYSYISSTIAPQGKRNIQLKIAGLNTLSECALGIDEKGESIKAFLNDNLADLFSLKEMAGEEKEFLYSLMKYRLSSEYVNKLNERWLSKNYNALAQKAIIRSKTIKHLNYLKKEI